jgi:hypothetical protein
LNYKLLMIAFVSSICSSIPSNLVSIYYLSSSNASLKSVDDCTYGCIFVYISFSNFSIEIYNKLDHILFYLSIAEFIIDIIDLLFLTTVIIID